MESIGQILKAARERQGRTIVEAAEAIKAKQMIIQALEADDFDELIAPVYARGFIKLYAEYLGLNPQPLLKIYRRQDGSAGDGGKFYNAGRRARPPAPPPPTAEAAAWRSPLAPPPATPAIPASPPDSPPAAQARKHTPPRIRQFLRGRLSRRIHFKELLQRLRQACRPRLTAVRRGGIALASRLQSAAAAGGRGLVNWLRAPHARRAGLALAAVLLLMAVSAALRQAWLDRRAQYTPPPQYGWLQPPPDPYP